MAEWFKAHAWKACVGNTTVGSNPTLSASLFLPYSLGLFPRQHRHDFRRGALCLQQPRHGLHVRVDVVELAGLPVQKEIEGTSLVPLLKRPSAKWDKPAYGIWSEDGKSVHGVAVRTEQWRYAEYGKDGTNGAMLLDPRDPNELKNFADGPEHKSAVAGLSTLTRKYAAAYG